MQSLQSSRIPHLALSIISKRTRPAHKSIPNAYLTASIVSSRRHASPVLKNSSQRKLPRPPTSSPPSPVSPVQAPVSKASSRQITRGLYYWVASGFAIILGVYSTVFYVSYRRSVEQSKTLDLAQSADVSSRWMDLSRDFDDEVNFSEKFIGLGKRRAKLCREAHGNVLEVSCGTGRNMQFYDLDPLRTPREMRIKSLVFNDQSEIMVYQAQKKYDKIQEDLPPMGKFKGPVKFVVGDGGSKRVINRPEGGFDVIIQTMGICSMANPVAFLKRLGELSRQPGEKSLGISSNVDKPAAELKSTDFGASDQVPHIDKGGKILLLEHGRSKWDFVNNFLDDIAKQHADRYGCWFNKDIEQIVRDSGLVIESMNRYNFGTTYEFVLRPASATAAEREKEKS